MQEVSGISYLVSIVIMKQDNFHTIEGITISNLRYVYELFV